MKLRLCRSVTAGALAALVACTTNVDDPSQPSYGKSTLVATSANDIRTIVADATNLYWIDSAGQLVSCSKTACGNKSTVLSGGISINGAPPAMAIANGTIYWADRLGTGKAPLLFSCPVTGCPGGPTSTMIPGPMAETIGELRGDATGVYFTDSSSNGTIYRCTPPGCTGGPTDVLARLRSNGCNPNAGPCACVADSDCGNLGMQACDWATKKCVECTATNRQVCNQMGTALTCDVAAQKCVKCNGDAGSTSSAPCDTSNMGNGGFFCTTSGTCDRCRSSADCMMGAHAGPVCDQNFGICGTSCHFDTDCMPTQVCTSMSMGQTGVCAPKLRNGSQNCQGMGRFCASGVCDSDNSCGTKNGGACTTNATCRAGACGSDGMCGLPNGEACTSSDSCRASYCSDDGKCGKPDGVHCQQATECRSGQCTNGTCGMLAGSISTQLDWGFAVAGGRVYFAVNIGSVGMIGPGIASCPADRCGFDTLTVHLQKTSSPNGGRVLAADDKSVYFSDGMSLLRCDLPTCDTSVVTLGPLQLVRNGLDPGPALLTSANLYVPSNGGNNGIPFGRCARSGCAGGVISAPPDPALDTQALGVNGIGCNGCSGTNYRPFTVDATNVYWATSTIFGAPGNQLVSTPE